MVGTYGGGGRGFMLIESRKPVIVTNMSEVS